jgi:hypothetical protein
MAVFWVVAPCSLVEVYQRFGGPCCLHHQGDLNLHLRLVKRLEKERQNKQHELVRENYMAHLHLSL